MSSRSNQSSQPRPVRSRIARPRSPATPRRSVGGQQHRARRGVALAGLLHPRSHEALEGLLPGHRDAPFDWRRLRDSRSPAGLHAWQRDLAPRARTTGRALRAGLSGRERVGAIADVAEDDVSRRVYSTSRSASSRPRGRAADRRRGAARVSSRDSRVQLGDDGIARPDVNATRHPGRGRVRGDGGRQDGLERWGRLLRTCAKHRVDVTRRSRRGAVRHRPDRASSAASRQISSTRPVSRARSTAG